MRFTDMRKCEVSHLLESWEIYVGNQSNTNRLEGKVGQEPRSIPGQEDTCRVNDRELHKCNGRSTLPHTQLHTGVNKYSELSRH